MYNTTIALPSAVLELMLGLAGALVANAGLGARRVDSEKSVASSRLHADSLRLLV